MSNRIERFTRDNVPTWEKLAESLEIDEETAIKLYVALTDEWQLSPMQKANEILGGHGIESIGGDGDTRAPFSYVNNGDSYAWTLMRDHNEHAYMICGWADAFEEYERENELGDFETFDECPDRCPCCHGKHLTLTHFPNSARGDTYSWVCNSCNHHCFAVEGYEPSEAEEIDEDA